ncbi:DUF2750 domain-containing protein [Microbacterium oleivorans]|uniref:DUF2750 domain-containing protein n=1 Tax=Microbacterium oleivorans TaxID=273677 RepID=A0A177KCD8_9MICO|nr:DUF2750 domain-containing protein [Microbacterium oleivorans]OAH51068.1 hypothetical protein AYL44_01945 [Microbacterium oleivorans]
MTVSAAHMSSFFSEVLTHQEVFTISDEGGVPAPKNADGRRAMPFWSLETRAQRIIEGVSTYRAFTPIRLTLEEFRARWLPGLTGDGLLVGINWSGETATGYDLTPGEVESRLR